MNNEDVLNKLKKYCAYQERSHQEVRYRIIKENVYGDDLEVLLYELIQQGYLNEERYAMSYARGKFRLKKWGKVKISSALKQQKVSDYCIKKALQEIDPMEYQNTLDLLIMKKWKEKNVTHSKFQAQQKIYAYCIRKGYEASFVSERIQSIITNSAKDQN